MYKIQGIRFSVTIHRINSVSKSPRKDGAKSESRQRKPGVRSEVGYSLGSRFSEHWVSGDSNISQGHNRYSLCLLPQRWRRGCNLVDVEFD